MTDDRSPSDDALIRELTRRASEERVPLFSVNQTAPPVEQSNGVRIGVGPFQFTVGVTIVAATVVYCFTLWSDNHNANLFQTKSDAAAVENRVRKMESQLEILGRIDERTSSMQRQLDKLSDRK